MKFTPMHRVATLVPAAVAAFLAGSLISAPAAQADEGHGCAGAYVKYTSKGDYLYVKDKKKDGRTVFVNLTGPGGAREYHVTRGAGKSYTWNLDRPERKTNKIIVSLVTGDPYRSDSDWKHCTTFEFRT